MSEPTVTIVIVPRERFSFAVRSLDNVLAHTDFPFRLIYVDGGSPRQVRRQLRRRADEKGFELIRVDRYLTPNQARNIGLRLTRTKYVVFLDNDTLVTPGWLAALVRCAEETGAAVCGPLQLIGPLEAQTIHLAGGIAHIVESAGQRKFRDGHQFPGRQVPEVQHLLTRQPCELIEFHCALLRTEIFERLGLLDEGLRNAQEYADLCLMARDAKLAVFFEPSSIATYVPPPPFAISDLPFFLLRWSEEWTRAGLDHFAAKWHLDPDDSGLDSTLNFIRWHRRLPVRYAWSLCERIAGPRINRFKQALAFGERVLTRSIVRSTRFMERFRGA